MNFQINPVMYLTRQLFKSIGESMFRAEFIIWIAFTLLLLEKEKTFLYIFYLPEFTITNVKWIGIVKSVCGLFASHHTTLMLIFPNPYTLQYYTDFVYCWIEHSIFYTIPTMQINWPQHDVYYQFQNYR